VGVYQPTLDGRLAGKRLTISVYPCLQRNEKRQHKGYYVVPIDCVLNYTRLNHKTRHKQHETVDDRRTLVFGVLSRRYQL
jgi:hypothetical protein